MCILSQEFSKKGLQLHFDRVHREQKGFQFGCSNWFTTSVERDLEKQGNMQDMIYPQALQDCSRFGLYKTGNIDQRVYCCASCHREDHGIAQMINDPDQYVSDHLGLRTLPLIWAGKRSWIRVVEPLKQTL